MSDRKMWKTCEICCTTLDTADFPYRKYMPGKSSRVCTECDRNRTLKWKYRLKMSRKLMTIKGNAEWESYIEIGKLFYRYQLDLGNIRRVKRCGEVAKKKSICKICGKKAKLFMIMLDWGDGYTRKYPIGCYTCWRMFCRIGRRNRGGWKSVLNNVILTLSDDSIIKADRAIELLKNKELCKNSPRYLLALIKRRVK